MGQLPVVAHRNRRRRRGARAPVPAPVDRSAARRRSHRAMGGGMRSDRPGRTALQHGGMRMDRYAARSGDALRAGRRRERRHRACTSAIATRNLPLSVFLLPLLHCSCSDEQGAWSLLTMGLLTACETRPSLVVDLKTDRAPAPKPSASMDACFTFPGADAAQTRTVIPSEDVVRRHPRTMAALRTPAWTPARPTLAPGSTRTPSPSRASNPRSSRMFWERRSRPFRARSPSSLDPQVAGMRWCSRRRVNPT